MTLLMYSIHDSMTALIVKSKGKLVIYHDMIAQLQFPSQNSQFAKNSCKNLNGRKVLPVVETYRPV